MSTGTNKTMQESLSIVIVQLHIQRMTALFFYLLKHVPTRFSTFSHFPLIGKKDHFNFSCTVLPPLR
jgi:hypothetical protein